MTKFHQILSGRYIAIFLAGIVLIQSFACSLYERRSVAASFQYDTLMDIFIDILDWGTVQDDATDTSEPMADNSPESGDESEEETSESDDSKFYEHLHQRSLFLNHIPGKLTFFDHNTLRSPGTKIPTPPPECLSISTLS